MTNTGYKNTMMGEIPEDWSVRPLSEVGQYINGMAFKPSEWRDQGIPIVRIENLNNIKAPFNYYQGTFEPKYLLENGELLLSWSASLGVYLWDRGRALLNQHIFKVIPNESVSKHFLYWALHKAVENLGRVTHGSTMKHFKKGELEQTIIGLPSFPEQQKIAEILTTADAAIQKVDEQITLTEHLKKDLMQRLLTRGIGHTRFRETVIGKIPEEWETAKLVELSEHITKGTTPTSYGFEYTSSGIHFIKVESIDNQGKFVKQNISYISQDANVTFSRSILRENDILFSIAGALGRVAVVNGEILPANVNQALSIIRLKDQELLSVTFLKYFLMGFQIQNLVKTIAIQSQQANINLEHVRNFLVAMPSLGEQQKIAEILSSVDDKLNFLRKKTENLKVIKHGLMDYLLTGKVRVKV